MGLGDDRPRLNHGSVPPAQGTASRAMQVVAKAAALIGGAILLVSALALSLFFFAVLIVGGVLIGGYLWWKTRELRRQIRTQMSSSEPFQAPRAAGEVIEGEIIEGEIVGRGAPIESERADDAPRDRLQR